MEHLTTMDTGFILNVAITSIQVIATILLAVIGWSFKTLYKSLTEEVKELKTQNHRYTEYMLSHEKVHTSSSLLMGQLEGKVRSINNEFEELKDNVNEFKNEIGNNVSGFKKDVEERFDKVEERFKPIEEHINKNKKGGNNAN